MTKTILIVGFVQSLFGVLIFITKKTRHFSFTILTIWLAIIAIFFGGLLLPFEVVDYFKPGIFPILFLWGPLLCIYVSSLTIENYKLKRNSFLHLIPLLAVGIHRSMVEVISVTGHSGFNENPNFIYNKIYYLLLGISLLSYWMFSLNLILKHRKNIPFYFSNYTAKNTLSWLIFMMSLFLFFFLAELFIPYIEKIVNTDFVEIQVLSLNLTFFTFIIIFFGINQSVIYESKRQTLEKLEQLNEKTNSENKYKRSSLNDEQINELIAAVFSYLKDKKSYLNPDFSLQMMAEGLSVSRQKLSQAINAGQQKNFYQIINEFRIEEVKQMLINPSYQHFSVLGIAFECGFNSKSSFNRIFKEETGFTPTKYKKSL